MSFETITIIGLLLFMIVREVMHYFQVIKLQELLKSIDITEYYKARGLVKPQHSPSENVVMEQNDISSEEEDFDIRKVSKVIVDGEEKPINIIP